MINNKIVGLDIGTSCVRVAIGEPDPETGKIAIIGTSQKKSAGLRNGVIVNIEEAKNAIKNAVDAAEQNAGTIVESVITAVGGDLIESQNSRGVVPVSSTNKSVKEIGLADILRVQESATAVKVSDDKEQLHAIPQDYIVDGVSGIKNPIHTMGTRLEVELHIITVSKSILQNLRSCISRAGYVFDTVMLKTLAATRSVCYQDEMDLGSILIDLGAGTTDVLVLFKGAPISTASVPVGGNFVTNDLSVVMGIPVSEAEKIKIRYGCCWLPNIDPDGEVDLPGVGGRPPEVTSRSQVCQIIQARMEQIFTMVKSAVVKNTKDSIRQLSGNIILTGGGANMDGVVELAQNVFQTSSVRIGYPDNLGGVEEDYRRPDFATAIGLVVASWEAAQTDSVKRNKKSRSLNNSVKKSGDSFMKKAFKKLF